MWDAGVVGRCGWWTKTATPTETQHKGCPLVPIRRGKSDPGLHI